MDNNVATGAGGGGIHNTGGQEIPNFQGYLVLTDTTVLKNGATAKGGVGGIASSGTGALITLARSTIADNIGAEVGGLSPTGPMPACHQHDLGARPRVAGSAANASGPGSSPSFVMTSSVAPRRAAIDQQRRLVLDRGPSWCATTTCAGCRTSPVA